MEVLVLKPHSVDSSNYWSGLQSLGHNIGLLQYDIMPHDKHIELVETARKLKPDAIIFIGAHERSFGLPVIQPDNLKRFKEIAPLIHMCGDAGDEPWWDQLQMYDREQCFTVQVSLDGVYDCPIALFKNGMVKLTPIDPRPFANYTPWQDRTRFVGVTGGHGHSERGEMMNHMIGRGVAWFHQMSYAQMADGMGQCKIIVNCPMCGSAKKDQVKGRVVETAWAGACLFERTNNFTRRWFGSDFVEYNDLADLDKKLQWAKENDATIAQLATNMRNKVAMNHHPQVFWWDVFGMAGVKDN